MNRVICVKGHFYDGDKYSVCPHCAEGVAAATPEHFAVARGNVEEIKEVKKEKKGLFHKKDKTPELPVSNVKEEKTEMYMEDVISEPEVIQNTPKEESIKIKSVKSISPAEELPKPKPRMEEAVPVVASLSDAFSKVAEKPQTVVEEGKTVGFYSTGQASEPPVGYLICIVGEDFGTGFPLKSGNNSIGRSASMDVALMDAKVSRQKQAYVMYEPYKREFYIKPGESSGLCYFNDEVVLGPVKMKQFDTLTLGDTKLMLIAVCCEQFSWDDYMKE